MTDEQLTKEWTALNPTVQQCKTMERRVAEWLEAEDTSLTAQWLAIFKVRPVAVFGFAIANALSLVPLGLLNFAVLQ